MRARKPLWRTPEHRVGASPTHGKEQKTFLSSPSPTRRWRSPLRHPLTTLASAAALSIVGLAAVTVPAYADEHQTITDSADPVTVNTPYNYIVTIIDPLFEGGFGLATIDLSGATATFTGVITSDNASMSCSASGTHAECIPQFSPGPDPLTITATVLPTATGTVTADTAREGMGPEPLGSDSTTTEIIAGSSSADLTAAVTDSPDPASLGNTVTYTATVTNDGPDNATDVSAVTTLSGAARTIISATTTQGSCTVAAPTVTCPLGDLADNATATITITVQPTATGTLTATTTVTGAETDPATANNTANQSTTITNATPVCTITGTAGNDILNGTNGNDVLCGLGGNDILNGGDGNDTLNAGPGNDIANGGNGNDTLTDTSGTDILNGSNGSDTINVQDNTGGDLANGGLGSDTCTADPADLTTSC